MFIVCGEALFDVFAEPAAVDGSMRMRAVVGGSPFNVAVGLARMGVPTGFLGGLSTDPFGEALARRLEDEGVSHRYVIRRPEKTTLALVTRDASGAPSYAFYGGNSADRSFSDEAVPLIDKEVPGLHFGSCALVAQPAGDALLRLAERERHRFISYDPNVRLTVEPRREIWQAVVERMLPITALLKISAEDIELLWPGSSPAEVGRSLSERGPTLVVVTLGEKGLIGCSQGTQVHVPARRINLVDTVGAGDAVQAQLIAILHARGALSREALEAMPLPAVTTLLECSCEAGARTCEKQGADPPRSMDFT